MSNSSCTGFPKEPHLCDIIIGVRKFSGSLSFVGCVFMIFIIWLFKRYVVFAQRLILYLSFAALLDSIGSFLMPFSMKDCSIYLVTGSLFLLCLIKQSSDIRGGPVCNFQGWWLTFFDWVILLCVSCITFNLFMNVIKQTVTEKYEWLYLGISFVIPFIISCLPFSKDRYGPAGAWCWIVEDFGWRIGIWYGPLFVIIVILMVTYGYIIYSLSRKASSWEGTYDPDTERQHRLLKEDIKPLRVYPFIYLAVSIFPLINRIQNALSPDNHVFVLFLLSSISAPLQGALNAVVFGMDKETLYRLRPSEIKLAIQAKRAPRSIVQEYPQPDAEV